MGLTDWESYKSDAGNLFVLETTSQIHGSGSLKFTSTATTTYQNIRRAATPRGFTSGRARFLFKNTLRSGTFLGFAFQQSQADLTGASGTAYFVCNIVSGTATAQRLGIYRLTAGLPTKTQLFQGTGTFTATEGAVVSIEAEWILDITNLGGIRFNVKRGTATDFSNLVDEPGLINQVSTSTILQTSVGEGPAAHFINADSYIHDRISAIPLLVGG